jgi:hypothetical protein
MHRTMRHPRVAHRNLLLPAPSQILALLLAITLLTHGGFGRTRGTGLRGRLRDRHQDLQSCKFSKEVLP